MSVNPCIQHPLCFLWMPLVLKQGCFPFATDRFCKQTFDVLFSSILAHAQLVTLQEEAVILVGHRPVTVMAPWSTWALTSLPALLFTCKPVYLHYMDSSPSQDRKPVFTYTDGNQQEEHNGSPHLQGWPYREASLPRRNPLLYQLQIHYNIPCKHLQLFSCCQE